MEQRGMRPAEGALFAPGVNLGALLALTFCTLLIYFAVAQVYREPIVANGYAALVYRRFSRIPSANTTKAEKDLLARQDELFDCHLTS